MKSFQHSYSSSTSRANAIQRVEQPVKTIVDNRPQAIAQRKLQEQIGQSSVIQQKLQNAIAVSHQPIGQTQKLLIPKQPVLARAGATIQRMPFDKNMLAIKGIKFEKLDASQTQRLNAVNNANETFIFENADTYKLYIETGDETLVNKISLNPTTVDLSNSSFKNKFSEAKTKAKKRKRLTPFKARTEKRGVLVDDVDKFNALSKEQLPELQEGNFIYESEKHKKYKTRKTATATDNWAFTLYQDDPKKPGQEKPVAYNYVVDNRLEQTLFQYSQGKGLKKRHMAGLEGPGKTPKWKNSAVKKQGKKRKLNSERFPQTLVQGHGQDFEQSVKFVGEYGPKNAAGKRGRIDSVSDQNRAKRIKTSDDHPHNFSTEKPTYGQNYRNFVLGKAKKSHPQGAFIEKTIYHNDSINVVVPEGFGTISTPKEKQLTLFDSSGSAVKKNLLPQFEVDANNKMISADYAQIASDHQFNKTNKRPADKDLEMAMLDEATQETNLQIVNSSFIDEKSTNSITSWNPSANDSPTTQQRLKRRRSFHYLKPKDFV